ncbi:hypothetical protein BO83DRAFT_454759 [Aspergillus eucalypticola CBS 122712]|uniref:Uncharacterized protein n=1 Tax=Aspergillus eucalypticola (strain CBS 122712 / IBT 29274) TaxID=1448314 RepID=A0A317WAE9_ASPEC|nr:uncharacterized protein BO83DRAFT_454759 [Aspergillus eucalypticola CBS 122712]PWY82751.1 hypothetical protein BO83DRAFT_454759 [Aspergillus eucalypticola CBS 122712]
MDYIPCSFDAFIDNFLACYRPCYSDYLQQLVTNGTCGTNYTTLAASTDRSDLKCICENADGVSNNWTSQVLECTHSSCSGTFNYTRWADSMWSYDNMCYYASGTYFPNFLLSHSPSFLLYPTAFFLGIGDKVTSTS